MRLGKGEEHDAEGATYGQMIRKLLRLDRIERGRENQIFAEPRPHKSQDSVCFASVSRLTKNESARHPLIKIEDRASRFPLIEVKPARQSHSALPVMPI
jgi:hypothetical protein